MEILPITNEPSQRFNIILDDGVFEIEISWNSNGEFWAMCISTAAQEDIVRGVKLVPGLDLIRIYSDDRLPKGKLIIVGTQKLDRDSFANGITLNYITEAEVNDILQ